MVVYSDRERKVLEFHKLRRHVSRAGSFLGANKASQDDPDEHLAIFFFDVLLLDDEVTMGMPHTKRRARLAEVLTKIPGRALTTEWMKFDFSDREAKNKLITQFAAALSYRCEGLILKPNAPFFSLSEHGPDDWHNAFIKLKKDYMTEMGGERDVADFAIVGASYEVKQAQKCILSKTRWTNFYLGCLVNKEEVFRFQNRPTFKLVGIIKKDRCIPDRELKYLNDHGVFRSEDYNPAMSCDAFHLELGSNSAPKVLFKKPFVAEVGSAYEKPPNEDFFMLRHPRILRIHADRTWKECITMDELRQMADEARNAPPEGESQHMKATVEMLVGKLRKKAERRGGDSLRMTTPRSSSIAISPLLVQKSGKENASVAERENGNSSKLTTPRSALNSTSSPFLVRKAVPLTSPVARLPTKRKYASDETQDSRQTTPRSVATTVSPSALRIMDENHIWACSPLDLVGRAALAEVRTQKEVTPMSDLSTQFTSTIVTPRSGARIPLASISPPRVAARERRGPLRQKSPLGEPVQPLTSVRRSSARPALVRVDTVKPTDEAVSKPATSAPGKETTTAAAARPAVWKMQRIDTMDPLDAQDEDRVRVLTKRRGPRTSQADTAPGDGAIRPARQDVSGGVVPAEPELVHVNWCPLPTPPSPDDQRKRVPRAQLAEAHMPKPVLKPAAISTPPMSSPQDADADADADAANQAPVSSTALPPPPTYPRARGARPNSLKHRAIDDFDVGLSPRRKLFCYEPGAVEQQAAFSCLPSAHPPSHHPPQLRQTLSFSAILSLSSAPDPSPLPTTTTTTATTTNLNVRPKLLTTPSARTYDLASNSLPRALAPSTHAPNDAPARRRRGARA
ncbi:uncharacterized protein K452DRAFT_288947 [Aplosporella prunicola CBS 121167]|uniref:ATP-dependent DNA ligase family profile domain-containing protein n=1 Tax=Aplosporella prunicola CBS 121167 TaxID=1176127 RepID=A0A6A6BCI5_9PEZI|nr:uncharacterized protein K452DRAFT_288947 [Aplosporella prunicola CBS 121167]KAF2140181.1 hypothetical protein K452DRAFT_288947 [Aplosporella prunicola CBS 121167]